MEFKELLKNALEVIPVMTIMTLDKTEKFYDIHNHTEGLRPTEGLLSRSYNEFEYSLNQAMSYGHRTVETFHARTHKIAKVRNDKN